MTACPFPITIPRFPLKPGPACLHCSAGGVVFHETGSSGAFPISGIVTKPRASYRARHSCRESSLFSLKIGVESIIASLDFGWGLLLRLSCLLAKVVRKGG